MVPINTHNTVRTSPTRSSLSERMFGARRASWNILTLPPGNGGKRVSDSGISRATSAFAWSIVVPGFSRASAEKLNCPRNTLLRSSLNGTSSDTLRSRKRNASGSTPMISRGRLSTISVRPMTELSAPNFDRQYPEVRITVSRLPGASSVLENTRPSIGGTPSIGKTPSVMNSVGTSSGLRKAGDAHRPGVPQSDILEDPTFLAIREVQKRRGSDAWQVEAGRHVVERNELVGARIRERLQEHAFDDAEDRRVSPDAYCERHDGHGCEKGGPRKAAHELAESHTCTDGFQPFRVAGKHLSRPESIRRVREPHRDRRVSPKWGPVARRSGCDAARQPGLNDENSRGKCRMSVEIARLRLGDAFAPATSPARAVSAPRTSSGRRLFAARRLDWRAA